MTLSVLWTDLATIFSDILHLRVFRRGTNPHLWFKVIHKTQEMSPDKKVNKMRLTYDNSQ